MLDGTHLDYEYLMPKYGICEKEIIGSQPERSFSHGEGNSIPYLIKHQPSVRVNNKVGGGSYGSN